MRDTKKFDAKEFLIDLNESLRLKFSLQNDKSFNDTFNFVLNNNALNEEIDSQAKAFEKQTLDNNSYFNLNQKQK